MLKTICTAAAVATAVLAAPSPADAQSIATWYGRYVWEEPLGRVGGPGRDGVAIFVTRTLTLGAAAGPTGCLLKSEGYQTFETMRCTATPAQGTLTIKFYRTVEGRFVRHRLGETLFTMQRTPRGLTTSLRALRPTSDRTPGYGRLFRRIV
jgi:hypothetical protein